MSRFRFANRPADARAADQPGAAPAGIAEFVFDLLEGRFVLAGIDHGIDAFLFEDGAAGFCESLAQIPKALIEEAKAALELGAAVEPV